MHAIIATPAQSGIDPGGTRASLGMVSMEPERSFADYLEDLRRSEEPREAARDKTPDRVATAASTRDTAENKASSEKPAHAEKASDDSSSTRKPHAEKSGEAAKKPTPTQDEKKTEETTEKKLEKKDEPDLLIADGKAGEKQDDPILDKTDKDADPEKTILLKTPPRPESDRNDQPSDVENRTAANDSDKTESKASGGRTAVVDKVIKGAEKQDEPVKEPVKVSAGQQQLDDARTDNRDVVFVPETPDEDRTGKVAKNVPLEIDPTIRKSDRKQDDGVKLARAVEETEKPSEGSTRETRRSAETGRSREARADVVREITVNLSDDTEPSAKEKSGSDIRELTVRLDSIDGPGSNGSGRNAGVSVPEATGRLARQLNGSLGDNIVRQAKVILRNSDQGEIRLVIRPPELGRVRIQIQMDQGHIAGRILVDNQNVRQAIEQNLAALQRAFQEAGLEMGDLEVSTGDARQEAGSDPRQAGSSGRHRDVENGAEQFGKNVKVRTEYDYGRHRINLVA